jgi:hypothetical protein
MIEGFTLGDEGLADYSWGRRIGGHLQLGKMDWGILNWGRGIEGIYSRKRV